MRVVWLFVLVTACDAGEKPRPPPPRPQPPAQAKPPSPPPKPPEPEVRAPVAADLAEYTKDLGSDGRLVATIETSLGSIGCTLHEHKAPVAVANFVGLARGMKAWRDPNTGEVQVGKPFYDGLTFHRVIPSFMIQGGDPVGRGTGGPGYTFDDEIWDGAHVGPGVIAMANAGSRFCDDRKDSGRCGTNGSQFFVSETDNAYLDGKHTVFGTCKPLAVIKKIARVKTDETDRPIKPVTITKVTFARTTR